MFPSTSAYQPKCAVCGAEKAGYHYNGVVCSCCRVFFLRQTKRIKEPVCKFIGNCNISPGATDNCQACRYKKCLKANMKPEEVGRQRYIRRHRPSETPPIVPESVEIVEIGLNQDTHNFPRIAGHQSLEISAFQPVKSPLTHNLRSVTSNISARFMFLQLLGAAQTATDYTNCLITLQNYVDNTTGLDPIDVSLSDVLLNSQAAWDTFTPKAGSTSYNLKPTCLRSIAHFADYATSAPEILALEEVDKMKLIQYNCIDLNFLGAIYEFWQAKCEGTHLRARGNRFQVSSAEQSKIDALQKKIDPYFQYFCEKLGRLSVVKGELVILKYIILFTPPSGISENGLNIINQTREKYCTILSSYIAENNPFISVASHTERVAELIELEASIFIQQQHTGFVTNNTENLAGQLTYDFHLRDY